MMRGLFREDWVQMRVGQEDLREYARGLRRRGYPTVPD